MPRLAGSHALLQRLQQEGVEVLLGNPSSTELRLMDALAAGEPWVARGARRAPRAREGGGRQRVAPQQARNKETREVTADEKGRQHERIIPAETTAGGGSDHGSGQPRCLCRKRKVPCLFI